MVKGFFFCQKPFGSGSRPEPPPPPGALGKPLQPRPCPLGWAGPGLAASGVGSKQPAAGCCLRRSGSSRRPGRKLGEKFAAWWRVPWEARRFRSGPAGGEAESSTQSTLALYLLTEEGSKCHRTAQTKRRGSSLHVSDRWPRYLLLNASTDGGLTTSQGRHFLPSSQASNSPILGITSRSEQRKPVSLHKYNYSYSSGTRRPLF